MCHYHDDFLRTSPEDSSHVAINAHLLSGQDSYRSAGVHQYILHLLRCLTDVDDRMRFTALLGADTPAPDLGAVRSRWPTSKPWVRVLWEQLVQPRALREIKADLLHGPVFVGPLRAPCPIVITVHDLSFIRFPDLFHPANRLYLKVMTRLSTHRARRLIAVSNHTAAETARLLDVPPQRIDVVHHGVDPNFRPLPAHEVAAFRQRQDVPDEFVLFVGTLEPRKNLSRLVEAFAHVGDKGIKLVLAGGRGWLYDDLLARIEELDLGEEVIFPGYVLGQELPLWYNAATALAYPSLYEGFGLPVLEAQACGTPVLTSNTSSLPEAAGDAALTVDPYHVDAIAEGLNRLLVDEPLRQGLRERGLARVREFAWLRTAEETVRVYRRALSTSEV